MMNRHIRHTIHIVNAEKEIVSIGDKVPHRLTSSSTFLAVSPARLLPSLPPARPTVQPKDKHQHSLAIHQVPFFLYLYQQSREGLSPTYDKDLVSTGEGTQKAEKDEDRKWLLLYPTMCRRSRTRAW
jgi:hypothetical protein